MILLKPSAVLEAGPHRFSAMETIEKAGRTCYKSDEKHEVAVQKLIDDPSFCPELIQGQEGCDEDDRFMNENGRLVRANLQVAEDFVRSIIKRGHESVLEHVGWTVRFICDRGVSHELVRHRLCAFSQESTRYVDYAGTKTDGHCQFIIPPWVDIEPGIWTREPRECADAIQQQTPKDAEAIPWWKHDGAWANFDCDYPISAAKEWRRAMLHAERSYQTLRQCGWSPQQARSVLPNSTKTEIVATANAREWRHILKLRLSKAAHPQMREVMAMAAMELIGRAPVLFESILQEDAS